MGLLSKLFGKNSQKIDPKKPLTPEMVDKIIQDYGYALEYEAPYPGTVADQNKLPYPKEQIKAALIIAMRFAEDEKMKEAFKVGFLSLACWQEGVGDEDQGLDFSKIDLNGDPDEAIKKYTEQREGGEKWTKLFSNETDSLAKELQDLGV
jgi:hypothetical protein